MARRQNSHAISGVLAALATTVVLSVVACGTSPVGVEACQRIEKVRCESAPGCNIDLGHPVHNGDTPSKAVAACIRYYDDQCLHGLVTTTEPGTQDVDACINAITTGSCDVVKSPETNAACSFLIPPSAAPASPADAAATDSAAASDAQADGG